MKKAIRAFLSFVPDFLYTKIQYLYHVGRGLNLNDPKMYYHKLQWLKLHWRDPLMHSCCDKYLVRSYVESKLGKEILIPIVGVYDSVEDIHLEDLPERFVLKATNGSGMNVLCRNKLEFNWEHTRSVLQGWLKEDFYSYGREWCYQGNVNRLICEEMLLDGDAIPRDYKVYCFQGEPKFTAVYHDRFGEKPSQTIYNADWEVLDCVFDYHYEKNLSDVEARPSCYDEMLDAARKLSEDFIHVRIDFYVVKDKLYFGEITFFTAGGYTQMQPRSYEYEVGKLINLDMIDKSGKYQRSFEVG